MNRLHITFRAVAAWLGMAALLAACPPAAATPLDITDTPLFLTTQRLYPNIILTLDDSISMNSTAGRDSINGQDTTKRYKAASYNALYYNPALAYTPPPRYNGTNCMLDSNPSSCYPNVSFNAAPINGFATSNGTTTNSSSACNPLGTSNKKYSPVPLNNNYAASISYSPNADTQSCSTSDGGTPAVTRTITYSIRCNVTFTRTFGDDRIDVAGCGSASASCAQSDGASCSATAPSTTGPFTTTTMPVGNSNYALSGLLITGTSNSTNYGDNDSYSISARSSATQLRASNLSVANNQSPATENGRTLTWSVEEEITPATAPSSYPAYYYLYYTDAGLSSPPANCTGTDAQKKINDYCYIKVVVGSASDIAGKDVAVFTSAQKALQRAASTTWPWTTTQQYQNFANWYSYYRTRNLSAVSSTMRAFAGIDGKIRVGWQSLASGDFGNTIRCDSFGTSCKGWDSSTTDNRVRRLDSINSASPSNSRSHKQELYDWLARFPVAGSTYMRRAALRVGTLIGGTVNISHPYADDPGFREFPLNPDNTSRTTYDGCRRNIHMIVTDGGWCGDGSDTAVSSVNDVDSNTVTVGGAWPGDTTAPYQWTPTYPFKDNQGDTLADVAMKEWATDALSGTASTDVANTVSPIYRANVGDAQSLWTNPKNDPATWQHINTYTIAFGLSETLNGTPVSGNGTLPIWQGSTFASDPVTLDGYDKLALGTSCPTNTNPTTQPSPYCWPGVNQTATCPLPSDGYDQQRKIYDLWHAAVNGRGDFFSAESPQDLSDAVVNVLGQAGAATSSFSALAANSTSLRSNTLLYQGKFDSRDWSGQLLAYPLGAGGVISNPIWDAALRFPVVANRHIYTYRDGAPATLSCAGSLADALNQDENGNVDGQCATRLSWLQGNHGAEQRNGGPYRDRIHTVPDDTDYDGDGLYWNPNKDQITVDWVLGDVISSNPVYVQAQDFGYTTLSGTEGSYYSTFLANNASRQEMIYVGANDGMLHAFRADYSSSGGTELFAFVPSGVYDNLSKLMAPGYTHRNFVDGSPSVGDAYLNNTWKSILVGSLGKGGKSVFALDVTDPATFATTNPAMWEFTDVDMGYSYSQPQIGRLKNGKWVAVFGNGYNSPNERAYLYIVDLENPAHFKKLAANILNPDSTICSSGCGNGLSTPVLFDSDNDKSIDYAYAGDLLGNMWRFDLNATSGNEVDTDPGLVTSFSGAPLFTARNSSNQVQPITGRPVVTIADGNRMVLFGTGRYLTLADATSTVQQSLYGIKDAGSPISTLDRSELLQQSIITQTTAYSLNVRTTTNNNITTQKGWYMDLPVVSGQAAERVIDYGVIINDRIVFVSNIPSNDSCTPGGTSWLIELGLANGARPTEPVLDLNADSRFDSADQSGGVPVSAVALGVGLAKPPVVVSSPGEQANIKVVSGTLGIGGTEIGKGTLNYAPTTNQPASRVYWLQIQ